MYRILDLLFSIPQRMRVLRPSSLKTSSCPLLHEEFKIPTQYENMALADLWKDVQGEKSWNGLLDPMNPVLKSEILRYGGFAEVCYDAFDTKLSSNKLGGCKYSRDKLFDGSRAYRAAGYEVTQYLYAETDTLWRPIDQSVWIGFIAVCTNAEKIRKLGRRDIVVAWRGTETRQEWIQNIKDFLVRARFSFTRFKHMGVRAGISSTADQLKDKGVRRQLSSTAPFKDKGVRVEKGFLSCYISEGQDSRCARDTVKKEIKKLVDEYKDESLSITITGHSLGAALATLCSYDVKEILNEKNLPSIPVTVFAFASPRVGNRAFARRLDELGVKVLRLVNKHDIVPRVPGLVLNENSWGWLCRLFDWLPWAYFHVGVEILLNSNDLDPVYAHSLTVYLDLIHGYV